MTQIEKARLGVELASREYYLATMQGWPKAIEEALRHLRALGFLYGRLLERPGLFERESAQRTSGGDDG